MKKSFFHLGSTPRLSAEEIIRAFPGADYSFHSFEHFLLIDADPQAVKDVFPEFGGSMRAGEVIAESKDFSEIEWALLEEIKANATEGKKMRIGINIFPDQKYHTVFPPLFKLLKNASKEEGISLRIVNRKGQNLDTSTAEKEGLFSDGHAEFSLFVLRSGTVLTRTLAVQNIESFAKRDFGKPVRDMGVGMLPPKLARMMVNLGRDEQGNLPTKIWDSFCGTGSVLLEALDMGIAEVMGSDLSEKMVDASRENIAYFSPPQMGGQKKRTFQHDATRSLLQKNANFQKSAYSFSPSSDLLLSNFTVVSEGFLGRIFTHAISDEEFFQQKDLLLPFYEKFLSARKKDGIQTIVLAIPFWKGKEKEYSFSQKLLEMANKIGYDASAALLYRRPQQFVGREILVFHGL
ncbi:MAG: hypothetical protein WCJ84_01985 [Candidatus Peregrinibacteria bacterium]